MHITRDFCSPLPLHIMQITRDAILTAHESCTSHEMSLSLHIMRMIHTRCHSHCTSCKSHEMPFSLHIMHITQDATLTAHHAHHTRCHSHCTSCTSHERSTHRDATPVSHAQHCNHTRYRSHSHEMPLSLHVTGHPTITAHCCTSRNASVTHTRRHSRYIMVHMHITLNRTNRLWCTNRSQGHDRKVRFAQEHKSTQVFTQPCFARWALCWPWPSTPCMCMHTGLHGHH
jgi:hypothetical protein